MTSDTSDFKLGIIGNGQLGMMLAQAAQNLGSIECTIYAPSEGPATQVAKWYPGSYEDQGALQAFAAEQDGVTYEFESLPITALKPFAHKIHPSLKALSISQDRLFQKEHLQSLGISTAPFCGIETAADLEKAIQHLSLPCILKTRTWGYDGRGQVWIRTPEDIHTVWDDVSRQSLILEQVIPFERELSLVAARSHSGDIQCYPLVQNHHEQGILHHTVAPAPNCSSALQQKAESYAKTCLEHFEYVGVMVLELFEVSGELLINEIACRVHNSGHWSIEGASVSQFEQHLRALTHLPLKEAKAEHPTFMINLLSHMNGVEHWKQQPQVFVHDYGKSPAPQRKLGHLNMLLEDSNDWKSRWQQFQETR